MLKAPKIIEFIKKRGVKISPTEPTTGEEVWFKKSKNIIPTDIAWESGTINDSGVETASSNTVRSVNYIGVVPSQQYIASYNAGSGTSLNVVACYDENKQFISRLTAMGKNAFTLPANSKYIRPAFYNANGLTPAQVVSNITNKQIEQGSTATGYEAPINKEIYCKNKNGIYERFYSETDIDSSAIVHNGKKLNEYLNQTNFGFAVNRGDRNYIYTKIAVANNLHDWDERNMSLVIQGTHNTNRDKFAIAIIKLSKNNTGNITAGITLISSTSAFSADDIVVESNGTIANIWLRTNDLYASYKATVLISNGWECNIDTKNPTTNTLPSSGYTKYTTSKV